MPSTGVKLQTYNLANTKCNFDPPPLSFRKMQNSLNIPLKC